MSSSSPSKDTEKSSSNEESSGIPVSTRGRHRTGRGRGRGRGRGKGPAREKGGKKSLVGSTDPDEHFAKIQKEMEDEISKMNDHEMRSVLLRAIQLDPTLMIEVLKPSVQHPGQGYHPPPGTFTPDWCVCGHCREMPTESEKKCCGKATCITLLTQFHTLILDEGVLALARLYRRDILVFEDDEEIKKANRHQAYRQFILWTHGRLGAGHRKVIPSCCVWKIRDKFPDPFGQYTGFIPSRF